MGFCQSTFSQIAPSGRFDHSGAFVGYLRLLAYRGGEGKLGVALRLERILG
jgi:hypothetical protein